MRMVRRRDFAAVGLLVALAGGLTACSSGSDSNEAVVEETTTTQESTTTTKPPQSCTDKFLFEAAARNYNEQPVQVLDLSCSAAFAIATLRGDPLADVNGEGIAYFSITNGVWQVSKVVPSTSDVTTSAPEGVPATLAQAWVRKRDARLSIEAEDAEADARRTTTSTAPPATEPPVVEPPVDPAVGEI